MVRAKAVQHRYNKGVKSLHAVVVKKSKFLSFGVGTETQGRMCDLIQGKGLTSRETFVSRTRGCDHDGKIGTGQKLVCGKTHGVTPRDPWK